MKTDWDIYYSKSFFATRFTRQHTAKLLLKLLGNFCSDIDKKWIVELGGANSCFYEPIKSAFNPAKYHVIDNNVSGLMKFKEKSSEDRKASWQNLNILESVGEESYDISFSIGLIEHFDRENTARAISAHFDILHKGGIAIISFPTPTLLYLATRKICEILGIWFFHDERPLEFAEVISEAEKHGKILHKFTNWKAILTQGIIVVQKR